MASERDRAAGEGAAGDELAGDDKVASITLCIEHRYHIGMAARLQPERCFLADGLDVNALHQWKF